jgi:hypothetical protein
VLVAAETMARAGVYLILHPLWKFVNKARYSYFQDLRGGEPVSGKKGYGGWVGLGYRGRGRDCTGNAEKADQCEVILLLRTFIFLGRIVSSIRHGRWSSDGMG